jgi:hypothetical protein
MASMFSEKPSWTLHDNINVIIQLQRITTADDNVKVQQYAIEDNIHVNIHNHQSTDTIEVITSTYHPTEDNIWWLQDVSDHNINVITYCTG